jgi:putative transposase
LAFRLVITIKQRVCLSFHSLQKRFLCWVKLPTTSLLLGTLVDLTRGKSELLAENALLRQQLIILRRQIKRPVYRKSDRLLLVLLASILRTWKQALFLVQPETLLRWHRGLFRLMWKHKSKAHSRKPRLSPETISLIKEMAANNRLWGAERIRGELLKLEIRVSKRTIQKYMKQVRPKRSRGQTWRTFLRNHAAEVWACDFLQVTDLFFRPLFAFFIIELQSRKVIHVNVRRECLDHFLIFHEKQLQRLLQSYVLYFNHARPHQGLGQRIPEPPMLSTSSPNQSGQVRSVPVLGGLHYDYRRAA